jgi:hypothetical protein
MTRPPRRPSALAGRSPAQPDAQPPAAVSPPSPRVAVPPTTAPAPVAAGGARSSTKRIPTGKVQFTVYVPTDTRREARNAARHLGGRVPGLSNLSALVATAIDKEVAWLADTYNGGKPFPDSDAPLTPGPSPE